MVKEGMASGIVIIGINYSGALINETEVLSDLDQILFFSCTILLETQPQFSEAWFLNYMSSTPFEYNNFSYLINAIQLSTAFWQM